MAKITAKERKIREMERQDAEGISRKKWDHTINPNLFFMLKLLCIVLIPIFYFVYSPVLILLMIFYVFLFFLAIMAERRMNTSVIKKNHIHIPKFDCAIALIVIIIALSGSFMSSSSKSKASMFSNLDSSEITEFVGERNFDGAKTTSFWNTVSKWFINFGSCLTGERNMISQVDNRVLVLKTHLRIWARLMKAKSSVLVAVLARQILTLTLMICPLTTLFRQSFPQ